LSLTDIVKYNYITILFYKTKKRTFISSRTSTRRM